MTAIFLFHAYTCSFRIIHVRLLLFFNKIFNIPLVSNAVDCLFFSQMHNDAYT